MMPTDVWLRAVLLQQTVSGDASVRFAVDAAWRRAGRPAPTRLE